MVLVAKDACASSKSGRGFCDDDDDEEDAVSGVSFRSTNTLLALLRCTEEWKFAFLPLIWEI